MPAREAYLVKRKNSLAVSPSGADTVSAVLKTVCSKLTFDENLSRPRGEALSQAGEPGTGSEEVFRPGNEWYIFSPHPKIVWRSRVPLFRTWPKRRNILGFER